MLGWRRFIGLLGWLPPGESVFWSLLRARPLEGAASERAFRAMK